LLVSIRSRKELDLLDQRIILEKIVR